MVKTLPFPHHRGLVLTEMGHVVRRYADEIFSLGGEMVDAVKGRPSGQPLRLTVGVVDVVPKLIVRRLLQPGLNLPEPVRLVCHEDRYETLLADLAGHQLEMVISKEPVPSGSSVRAFNHLLGETGVTLFGTADLAQRHRHDFPKSLDGAPFLLPFANTTLRRSLQRWFEQHGIRPRVVAEFEDSALLKVFGSGGVGIFAAPTVIQADVIQQYGVKVIGHAAEVRERFYVITAERKLKNPAIVAICEAARLDLFSGHPAHQGETRAG